MPIASLVEQLSSLTLLQAAELSKKLEEKWGVSAAVSVAVASSVGSVATSAEVEKTEFDVILTGFNESSKINLIKEVRALVGLGLKEAKDLVEGAPKLVKEAVSESESKDIKTKLEAAGGKIEIR